MKDNTLSVTALILSVIAFAGVLVLHWHSRRTEKRGRIPWHMIDYGDRSERMKAQTATKTTSDGQP